MKFPEKPTSWALGPGTPRNGPQTPGNGRNGPKRPETARKHEKTAFWDPKFGVFYPFFYDFSSLRPKSAVFLGQITTLDRPEVCSIWWKIVAFAFLHRSPFPAIHLIS